MPLLLIQVALPDDLAAWVQRSERSKCFKTHDLERFLQIMSLKIVIQGIPLLLISIYRSPGFPLASLKSKLKDVLLTVEDESNVLVMGDVNSEENVISDENYQQIIMVILMAKMETKK